MPEGRLLALTEQIYDAGVGGTPWSVVCGGLKALVGARSASLMAGDFAAGRQEILYHAEIPEDAAAAYRRHYRKVDLWTNRASRIMAQPGAAAGPVRVFTSGGLVSDREFVRSEFYCDFGRKLGLRYVVGTVAPLGAGGTMPIGLHRPDGAPPFGERERRLLEHLLPHLRRSLQVRHRLAAPAALADGQSVLDALPTGALVVDAEMRVLAANFAAEALAAGGAGLALRREAGLGGGAAVFARARRRTENAALAFLVRATALGGAPGGVVRLQDEDDGTKALVASVAPLPKRLAGGSGAGRVAGQALVLLRDLSAPTAPPRLGTLRELFGLTRAQAEVAQALAGGTTKKAVAAGRGSRESTVRTHVRAVLDKTGAANLRELERLLAGVQGL